MTKLDELKQQIEALTDKFTEAEDLKKVGVISNTIDALEAENNKAKEDYNSLFADYRELVKKQAFKVDNTTPLDNGNQKEVNIEDFFKSSK